MLKITFEKIDNKTKEKVNIELIKKLFNLNKELLLDSDFEYFSKKIKSLVNKNGNIYLLYNNNKLVCSIIGEKLSNEEYYIKYFATNPYHKSKGFGTILMARVFADLRVNEKVKIISLHPLSGTANIIERLTGKKPFYNGKIRKFKSKISYTLERPKVTKSKKIEEIIANSKWKIYPIKKNIKPK